MKTRHIIQIIVLLLLLGGTAWLMRDKVSLISPRLSEKIVEWSTPASEKPQPTTDADGNPIGVKPPPPPEIAKEDLAPLSKKSKPLQEAPVPPARRAPVVFLAPFHGPNNAITPQADLLESMMRTYLRATPKDRLLINLVPGEALYSVYRRENGKYSVKGHGRDAYLQIAGSVQANVIAFATVTDSGSRVPRVDLELLDLDTSKTQIWSSSSAPPAPPTIAALLQGLVQNCASFAGISDQDFTKSGMLTGLPSDPTWDSCLQSKEFDDYFYSTVLDADPNCIYLYEYATAKAAPFRHIDRALKKWPDDIRLLRRKAKLLGEANRHYPSYLIYSELLRRYPDCLLLTHEMGTLVEKAYPDTKDATEAPPDWMAVIALLKNQAERFPRNYYTHWDLAACCDRLSWYIRGVHKADKIPDSTWKQMRDLYRIMVPAIARAAKLQPRSSDLLSAMLFIYKTAQFTDPGWQKQVIAQIHQIDPSNVRAEMTAASSHSVGWGSLEDYLELIDLAMRNHRGDARAMELIAYNLGTELSRQVAWDSMTQEEAYKQANPLSDRYIECVEFAMNNGVQVEKWIAGMLREIYRQRHGEGKVRELLESGKHWALTGGAAQEAHDAGDWEKTLRLARIAEPKSRSETDNPRLQYYIVKALWKLGRHDEALKEARDGIIRHPDSQVFYYMFAVVANEKGAPLEEAYERAYRAIDISTTNTGANETFESIRNKLNKPPHPRFKK